MNVNEFIQSLPESVRILFIVVLAVLAHGVVRVLRRLSRRLLAMRLDIVAQDEKIFARRFPKAASLTTILVSAITFGIYFVAVGLILHEFEVELTAYLASASVIGLAIAFGSQGFVQDVVIGLTLIFTDTLNLGDTVQLAGQIGRVDSIGLRFTTLVNFEGQHIFIPNRSISTIGRFPKGGMHALVDVQMPDGADVEQLSQEVQAIARSMQQQYPGIFLARPEVIGTRETKAGAWRYLRLKFKIWPGQNGLLEANFKSRVVALLRKHVPDYADWMVTVTIRAE